MMATRRLNRRQTSYVLAGSMGFAIALALAFFIFAMPMDLFELAILASHLPSLLAAAEPPLGETARMAVAGVGGLFAGAMTVVLFLVSDHHEEQRRQAAKRPTFSNAEFNMFAAPVPAAAEAAPLPAPSWAREAGAIFPAPVLQEDIVAESEPAAADDEPIFVDFSALRSARSTTTDQPLDLGQWRLGKAAEKEIVDAATEPTPATASGTNQTEEDSIAGLMSRLEAGLDRRAEKGDVPAKPPAIPTRGSGLRSTLDELRKMAVRG